MAGSATYKQVHKVCVLWKSITAKFFFIMHFKKKLVMSRIKLNYNTTYPTRQYPCICPLQAFSACTNASTSSMLVWFSLWTVAVFSTSSYTDNYTVFMSWKTNHSFVPKAKVQFYQFIYTRHFVEAVIWYSLKRSTLIFKCHVNYFIEHVDLSA